MKILLKNLVELRNPILICMLIFILPESELFAQRNRPVFSRNVITDTLRSAKRTYPADFDLDGDLDVVAVGSNTAGYTNVAWYENDGVENFTPNVISKSFPGARVGWPADLNNDGYPDILVGGPTQALTYFLNDGSPVNGGWTSGVIGPVDQQIYAIKGADFDNDDYIDLVVTYAYPTSDAGGDKVRFFRNNGDMTFSADTLISNYESPASVCIEDVNNDGDWDIVTSAFGLLPPPLSAIGVEDDISVFNNDGSQNFSQQSLNIPTNFQSPNHISSADMNGDGYADILAAAYFGGYSGTILNAGSLAWWENDQSGGFTTMHTVLSNFTFARSIVGADVDGDGDHDIVAAADNDNIILWLENDGMQNFTQDTITNNFTYAYYANPVDLDGDGDMDILASAQDAWEIVIWENNQDEARNVASGDADTTRFWGNKVIIDFSSGSEDTVTVFYNAGAPPDRNSLDTGIDHITTNGYYTITTRKTSYNADVDFYYGEGNVEEWSNITDENDLIICIWDESNSRWTSAGTQTIHTGDNRITVHNISNDFIRFSKWTLGSTTSDNPLPVQILAFSATITNPGVRLNWNTASEYNNLGFEILRSTDYDSGFNIVADYSSDDNLKSAGNAAQGKNYSFSDLSVEDNNIYHYKLNSVNYSGQKTNLGILKVNYVNALNALTFELGQNYPNPFNNFTRIPVFVNSTSVSSMKETSLIIYNILGEQIKQFNLGALTAGQNEILWDGKDNFNKTVASGQYIYRLAFNGKLYTKKLFLLK